MPGLADYLYQVQQNQQQNEVNPEIPNPFQSGIQSAMNGIQQSLQMASAPDKERAFREGIGRFGVAMGTPTGQNGLGWAKNAVQQGIERYQNSLAQQAHLNSQIYQEAVRQQEAEREYMRRMQEASLSQYMHQQDLEQKKKMHEEKLAQKERHAEMIHSDKLMALENKIREKDENNKLGGETVPGLYGIEYIPLSSLTKTAEREWSKESEKEQKTLDANKKSIYSLNEMEKIFDEYPDIGSSFLNLTVNSKGNVSFFDQLTRQFMGEKNKKKIAAIEKLKKLNASIRYDIIMGIPGAKGTDVMKNLVGDATASGLNVDEAFKYLANDLKKNALHKIKKIEVLQDAQKKGMKPLFSTNNDMEDFEISDETSLPVTEAVSIPAMDSLVKVKLPNGQTGSIPAHKLQEAISKGAVPIE